MGVSLIFRLLVLVSGLTAISCQASTSFTNGNTTIETTVEFCELVENPTRYDGKRIRVTAIMISGPEVLYLYNPKCIPAAGKGSQYFVKPSFMAGFSSEKLAPYISRDDLDYKSKTAGRLEAIYSGRFETRKDSGFGHLGFYDSQLVIEEVYEQRRPLDETPYPYLKSQPK